MNELQKKIDWAKGDGLVPAIVQHAISGRVLMLGYDSPPDYRPGRTSRMPQGPRAAVARLPARLGRPPSLGRGPGGLTAERCGLSEPL